MNDQHQHLDLAAESRPGPTFTLPGEPDAPYRCVADLSPDALLNMLDHADAQGLDVTGGDGAQPAAGPAHVRANLAALKMLPMLVIIDEDAERLRARLDGKSVRGHVLGIRALRALSQWVTRTYRLDPSERPEDGPTPSASDRPPSTGRANTGSTSKDGFSPQDPREVSPA